MDVLKLLYIYQIVLYILKLEKLVKLRKYLTTTQKRWWVKPHLRMHIRDAIGGNGGYQLIYLFISN